MSTQSSYDRPFVIVTEDDTALRQLLGDIYGSEEFTVLAGAGAVTTFSNIEQAAKQQEGMTPEQIAAAGRIAIHLDGNFPIAPYGTPVTITEENYPDLFQDPVVVRNRAPESGRGRFLHATLVARYAVLKLGIDNVGFILSSGEPQPFEPSDVLDTSAESSEVGRAAVWIVPKPLDISNITNAAAAINSGDKSSHIVRGGRLQDLQIRQA